MADLRGSTSPAPTGLFFLLRPGRRIFLTSTTASGSSRAESWSEEGLFLYLTAMYRGTFQGLHGLGSSDEKQARENILRLLNEWLGICSLDTGRCR